MRYKELNLLLSVGYVMKQKNKKITSSRELEKVLEENGFINTGGSKHAKWTNGEKTVAVSFRHKRFSMYAAREILKNAGIRV